MDKRTLIFLLLVGGTFLGIQTYFSPPAKPVAPPPPKAIEQKAVKNETLYVLENEYQQLVFSSVGGAIKEVNLPFNDLVRPIEFDTEMPAYNAQFPSAPAQNMQPKQGGYYPLLRRDLKGKPAIDVAPRFYLGNTVSDFPELAKLTYTVQEIDAKHIVLTADQGIRKIRKSYSFASDAQGTLPYVIDMSVEVEGEAYGLTLTSGVPDIEIVSSSPSPILKYRLERAGKSEVEKIDLPKEREEIAVSSLYPNWLSNSNGYFGIIIEPTSEIAAGYKAEYAAGSAAPSRLADIDAAYNRYPVADYPGYQLLLPLKNGEGTSKYRIFAGPYQDTLLKSIDKRLENSDFAASQTFLGWFSFISRPFAGILQILLDFFYMVTHSWGFSIILLTVALRIMLWPLNNWSFKSMKRMQQLTPRLQQIQERYKKDPKKIQMETMNLYREEKVNPFSGCLPMLIQLPFLIGMFDLLKSAFDLRGAPFIPGWIDNLTAPDVLFSWSYPLPLIGTQFHLLPFILGAAMFLQQRISSTGPKNVNEMTDSQRQQRMMGNIMTIVFTVMFYNFPSGLNIYWLSSMLLGAAQQWWVTKKTK